MGYFLLSFVIVTVLTAVWNVVYDIRHAHDPGYLRAGRVDFSDGHTRWWLTDAMTWFHGTEGSRRRRRYFLFGSVWFWIFAAFLYLAYICFRIIARALFATFAFIAQMTWLAYWPLIVRHGRRKAAKRDARDQARFERIDALLKSMDVKTKTNA